ncbi:hypothetical protein ACN27F_19760 [Solwaraspora sp. WMMB335]|uniref:hypothetical protein n=1 Tax=Solwaraspora sp. WMMB335 TaxID=3404118 RepID=UPI003B9316AF
MLTRVHGRRRRTVTALAITVLLATAGLALTSPSAAIAADDGDSGGGCSPTQPGCDAWVEDPGTPGGPGGGNGPGTGNPGGGFTPCMRNGEELDCYDDILGWFNRDDGCYYRVAEPQPPGGADGQTAYLRSCVAGQSGEEPVWLDDPPPGYEAPPDPDELRRRAYAAITFAKPAIRTAPGPGDPGLVGVPIWLWSEHTQASWGELDAERSDRGLTVRVAGKVTRVTYRMGNGDSVTCSRANAFTRYNPQTSNVWNPPCGYDEGYSAPGTYSITATAYWEVYWEINGVFQEVFDTVEVSNTATIEVDELQVVRE